MTPQPPVRRPFPVPALDALQMLTAASRPASERLWHAACAERLALEHHAMGLPGVAAMFRQDAVNYMKGEP